MLLSHNRKRQVFFKNDKKMKHVVKPVLEHEHILDPSPRHQIVNAIKQNARVELVLVQRDPSRVFMLVDVLDD